MGVYIPLDMNQRFRERDPEMDAFPHILEPDPNDDADDPKIPEKVGGTKTRVRPE